MTETLADIEALALQCRSDQSRTYIAESLQCYRAGAYRAAIVSAWIAVVFDLIDKVRELSLAGDRSAQTLEARHETYIEQIEQGNAQGIQSALEFERKILEACRDELQFFDPQQLVDLMRLREDRHRCAHPSFERAGVPYVPSAEQARLHIRNAIVHVLSKPPVQGKAALAELTTTVASAYFPTDPHSAGQQLRSSMLMSANDALLRGFVDQLVFGYLTKGSALSKKPQVIAALNAAFEMYPSEIEERLQKQLITAIRNVPDDDFPDAVTLVANLTPAWSLLDDASKEKIVTFIDTGPAGEVLGGLSALARIEALEAVVRRRIDGLDFDDLVVAIDSLSLGDMAKGRALHFLSEVRSWDRANDVFSKTILPLFNDLSEEDVRQIIRMPTEHGADLPGAHGYRLFIDKVIDSKILGREELGELLKDNGGRYLLQQEND